jgi:hypothetical protein
MEKLLAELAANHYVNIRTQVTSDKACLPGILILCDWDCFDAAEFIPKCGLVAYTTYGGECREDFDGEEFTSFEQLEERWNSWVTDQSERQDAAKSYEPSSFYPINYEQDMRDAGRGHLL